MIMEVGSMTAHTIINTATALIFGFGLVLIMIQIINLIMTKGSTKVVGRITNFFQEFTSRGFLWKASVEYELDGQTYKYITRARTARRSSGRMKLYITKRGRVIEPAHMVEMTLLGAVAIGIAIALYGVLL
jgi:hypothetical protein